MGNSFQGKLREKESNAETLVTNLPFASGVSAIQSNPNGKNELNQLPKELVLVILENLAVRDLLNASETCVELKSLAMADEVFYHRACNDYPLFECAFDKLSLEANKKDAYQYYKKIYTGSYFTRVHVHDAEQVNFKNFFAWYAGGGQLVGFRMNRDEYEECSQSLQHNLADQPFIENLEARAAKGEVRKIPQNIRHMKTPFEAFIPPPEIKCWADYFYIGEEIELQWGAGYFWWRGIVENIDGVKLHLIFTQWGHTSHYYREQCIFGKENGQCKGVRKLEIEQKLFYRRTMQAQQMRLWPEEWDSKMIDAMAQKNLVS